MDSERMQGKMILDFQGNIKESSGKLHKKEFGKTILYLLEEANVLAEKETKSQFRRLTINFKTHEYLIALDGSQIFVTLREVEEDTN